MVDFTLREFVTFIQTCFVNLEDVAYIEMCNLQMCTFKASMGISSDITFIWMAPNTTGD